MILISILYRLLSRDIDIVIPYRITTKTSSLLEQSISSMHHLEQD